MLQSEIKKAVRGTWWALVIRGVLAIVVGVLILARPLESVAAFALVIALWSLTQGVVNIVHAFELRGIVDHWWLLLLGGIISTVFGVAALNYYPALSLAFAITWTSWWLLLGGGAGISIALQERRMALPWGWTMVWGVLGVVAGIGAFANPPSTLATLMGFIAVFALVGGAALLVAAYQLLLVENDVAAAVRQATTT